MVITQIVQNIEAIINNSAEGRDILIYSGHDSNIMILSEILDVQLQVPNPPNYADMILIDLVDNGVRCKCRVFTWIILEIFLNGMFWMFLAVVKPAISRLLRGLWPSIWYQIGLRYVPCKR